MLCELARRDLARLRSAGYSPTDEEVVRLNDLAVLLARGKDLTAVNHPRVAFAGNVVLHEPTVGALKWWFEFGVDSACSVEDKLRTHYFMLANARRLDLLRVLQTPSDVYKAVLEWSKGVSATDAELFRAMMYVKHGVGGVEYDGKTEPQTDEESLDAIAALLALAAGQSGISPEDLKTETQTELLALIRASAKAGTKVKPSVARHYFAYQQTIREIESRGKVYNG